MSTVSPLTDLLDNMSENTSGESLTFGEMLNTVKSRSFGPLLLLPASVALSPVGAIPGMSIVTGTIIILIAVQLLWGLDHPWIPQYLESFKIPRERLTKALKTMRPWVQWVDGSLHKRLTFLTNRPFDSIVAGICILLAITFYPLALVPGGVALPSGAIVLFSLGLTSKDGLFVLIGLLLTAVSVYLTVAFWPF